MPILEHARKIISLVLLTAVLSGCAATGNDRQDTLYQDLGERSGIADIVEDLLYRIVDDPRIAFQFRGMDVGQFHQNLTDQLCELSGGPCSYTGRSMVEVHTGMNVTESQFNALAEHLILAMEKQGVSTGAQNRLLKKLIPLHPEITHL
ncbi:group 1 truncated hemoglobin [uncultured Marinobacter sp.]|uniref:group I truncated hemoglobin n=1 Tax=uncultured Marinobacter sp. TaxID=187379 RepID=UPI0030D74302|tara:strand:+ start:354 stop:800 length:447 start_codon:yes stop_codon:yes gene_type:complete